MALFITVNLGMVESKKQIKSLEAIDEALCKKLLKQHLKNTTRIPLIGNWGIATHNGEA